MVNPDRCDEVVTLLLKIHLVEYVSQIEDKNLEVFNMITGINESKTLIKYISYYCRSNLMVENKI